LLAVNIPAARRFLALLMSLFTLHLMVGSDAACASHGSRAAAAAGAVTSGEAGMHDASMPGMHAGSAQAPAECATPMPDRCCEAMSSCGVASHLSATTRVETPADGHEPARPGTVEQLASFQPAPEPPPPKA
jgi:hypothetical protein